MNRRIVLQNSGHARLLQHDLRHPYAIRIGTLAPRQLAPVGVVPGQQCVAQLVKRQFGSPCGHVVVELGPPAP